MNVTNSKFNYPRVNVYQRGLALVELMIAMAIGLFLLAGIVSLLNGTSQVYRTVQGAAEVQETGRFAIEYLARNIRDAGFKEYGGGGSIQPIGGWEGATSDPSPSSENLTNYTSQTDILKIQIL